MHIIVGIFCDISCSRKITFLFSLLTPFWKYYVMRNNIKNNKGKINVLIWTDIISTILLIILEIFIVHYISHSIIYFILFLSTMIIEFVGYYIHRDTLFNKR